MKDIFLIRHGQTDYNVNGIIQGGGIDSSLNEIGQEQAKAFFNYYKDIPFDHVFTSALKRTGQTVRPFIDRGVPHEAWAEINEMNWGVHEGQPFEQWMVDGYSKMIGEWSKGNLDARLDDGESGRQLIDRVSKFLDHLKTVEKKTILICSHGRAMRCMMSLIKEEHPSEMEKYKHSNTGLFKMKLNGEKFIVELENDTRHLEKPL